jgi:hypothetical protein
MEFNDVKELRYIAVISNLIANVREDVAEEAMTSHLIDALDDADRIMGELKDEGS